MKPFEIHASIINEERIEALAINLMTRVL